MKILCLLMALMAFALPAYSQDAEPDWVPFVGGIDGVPFMPGLVELTDETVVFDKPEGRIVDATAQSTSAPEAIMDWYSKTLADNGWQQLVAGMADGLLMVRDDEVLHIRLREGEGAVTLHFSLAPIEDD